MLIPVGLLAGYAYAAKYTAFPIAIYALGFVAWRSRRLRPMLVVMGCALIMAGPWIARNWIWYQNPVAPFANSIFRNPYVHVIFEQDYSESLRHYGMPSLRPLALEATIRGQYIGGIIGPVFLLLPVALLALRYRAGRRLLLAGALVFSTYFTNIGARFLIPCLPFFSLALGLAFAEAAPFLAALMLFHAAASWPPVLNRYVNPNCWRLVRFPYKAALRITPPDEFLRQNSSWIRRRADDRRQGAGRRTGFQHGRDSGFLHQAPDSGVAIHSASNRDSGRYRSTWAGTRLRSRPWRGCFNFRNARRGECAWCRRPRPPILISGTYTSCVSLITARNSHEG